MTNKSVMTFISVNKISVCLPIGSAIMSRKYSTDDYCFNPFSARTDIRRQNLTVIMAVDP